MLGVNYQRNTTPAPVGVSPVTKVGDGEYSGTGVHNSILTPEMFEKRLRSNPSTRLNLQGLLYVEGEQRLCALACCITG